MLLEILAGIAVVGVCSVIAFCLGHGEQNAKIQRVISRYTEGTETKNPVAVVEAIKGIVNWY